MIKLVLLRHGESTWNRENRFTGWTDVDLSNRGEQEAADAGRALRDAGYTFDLAFTSVLRRAIRTLWLAQESMDTLWLPVEKDWRLNERHYGGLQGLNKSELADHYGEEKVKAWRRGFDVRPPPVSLTDPRHPRHDVRYRGLSMDRLPGTESLEDTLRRVMEVWDERVLPRIRAGKRILVVAHGNTLRALIKHLEDIPTEDLAELNIPTGIPLVYELNRVLEVVTSYYLADDETVQAAARAVAKQGAAGSVH